MSSRVAEIERKHGKTVLPEFKVGDHVAVATLIKEAPAADSKDKTEKTRIQNFIGDVIAVQGRGSGRAFTVRRVVQGEGVERVFPFHSPLVQDVKVLRRGDVRRAKLYVLRRKSGKSARIREKGNPIDTSPATEEASVPEGVGSES